MNASSPPDPRFRVVMIGCGGGSRSGVPTFIARQMKALRALGVAVHDLEESGGLSRWRKMLVARLGVYGLPWSYWRLAMRADLLHFQWPSHLLRYGDLARRCRKPYVVSLRGRQINVVPYMPGQETYAAEIRRALPHCHGYHCVSRALLENAQEFGLVPERAEVITPAVDTDYFVPGPARKPGPPYIISMVGALIWRKGYEYALMSLAQMVRAGLDVHLRIVGKGEEQDRCQHTAADLGVADRLHLVGALPPEGVRQELHASHAFLHASLSEGISNAVLEAMACGLPVVATEAGGMGEVLRDGVNGYLTPLRDVDLMARRLSEVLHDAKLAATMGGEARRTAVATYDLRDQGQRFVAFYEKVLARR